MPEPVGILGSNIVDADLALGLTPEEQNLYAHHLNMLATGNVVNNADVSHSTLRAASVGIGGKTYNIPTVWDGKILPVREAMKRAAAKGWNHWPAYNSPEEADTRYALLHHYLERDQPLNKKEPAQRQTFGNNPAMKEF